MFCQQIVKRTLELRASECSLWLSTAALRARKFCTSSTFQNARCAVLPEPSKYSRTWQRLPCSFGTAGAIWGSKRNQWLSEAFQGHVLRGSVLLMNTLVSRLNMHRIIVPHAIQEDPWYKIYFRMISQTLASAVEVKRVQKSSLCLLKYNTRGRVLFIAHEKNNACNISISFWKYTRLFKDINDVSFHDTTNFLAEFHAPVVIFSQDDVIPLHIFVKARLW